MNESLESAQTKQDELLKQIESSAEIKQNGDQCTGDSPLQKSKASDSIDYILWAIRKQEL